jgi:hypothetical protein
MPQSAFNLPFIPLTQVMEHFGKDFESLRSGADDDLLAVRSHYTFNTSRMPHDETLVLVTANHLAQTLNHYRDRMKLTNEAKGWRMLSHWQGNGNYININA